MGGGPKKVKKRDDVILEWSLSKSKHLDDPFPDYVINGWTLWIYGIQKKKKYKRKQENLVQKKCALLSIISARMHARTAEVT